MRRQKAFLALLWLIAFLLRAWRIDLVHFQIDESIAAAVASQIGHAHRFPLTGIRTSFGFSNPPLYLYLLAPIFAVFRDPRAAMLVIAAAGSSAVIPVWGAARRLGGDWAGWAAAVIVAVSPNAVEFSRRLWGHDLMVILGAVAVWGAVETAAGRRWKPLAISFLAAGAAQCVHLSGVLYWIPGIIAAIMTRDCRGRGRAAAVGAGFLALMYAPWLVNEFREGFPDTQILAGQLFSGAVSRDLGIPVPAVGAWTMVLGDFWMNDLLGAPRPWWMPGMAAVFEIGTSLSAFVLLAGGVAYLALAGRRTRHGRAGHTSLLVLILATPLLFGGIMHAVVAPYLLPALAPAAVAGGLFVAWTIRHWSRAAGIALLCVYTVSATGLTVEVRRGIARGFGDGVPLGERMEMIDAIADASAGRPFYLMQDARNPETGLDVAYVYLGYSRDLSDRMIPRPDASSPLFVLREWNTRMRNEPAVFLHGCPVLHETNHLILHDIPPDRRAEWLELLRRFPAPQR